ncbi:response regulator [Pedobacter boryungensis]|uniref:Response regulator n=1 Tax=Pedobacter boryungensis TaxID=869962 RepID=A0ABX2DAL3_9SPHI|nr:response regulator [Pedobacter boryungensis]NQX31062.1 response regulator [Pedobacter boryungensis]
MRPITILLIEDNEGDILLTIEALEDHNVSHNIKTIKDGAAAIAYFEQADDKIEIPDLILLDINLPKRTGHEVLRFIKQHKVYCKIPVIMLTTSSSERDMQLAQQNGADAFMSKPLDIDIFMKTTNQIENF